MARKSRDSRHYRAEHEARDAEGRFEDKGYHHMSEKARRRHGESERKHHLEAEHEKRNARGEFVDPPHHKRKYDMDRHGERRYSRDYLDNDQEFGRRERGVFGRELGMGIANWDNEPSYERPTPLRNRFSEIHDCSMDEALRFVRERQRD